MEQRELTRQERAAIRSLVVRWCANYDREYGCLPLGCECYMLNKCWTGAYCRYFREAVLPLAPDLERSLAGIRGEPHVCPICEAVFYPVGKQTYCGPRCAAKARQKRQRAYMRERRGQR